MSIHSPYLSSRKPPVFRWFNGKFETHFLTKYGEDDDGTFWLLDPGIRGGKKVKIRKLDGFYETRYEAHQAYLKECQDALPAAENAVAEAIKKLVHLNTEI